MERHPSAQLEVHTTEELEALLGADIAERRQLRVWPLSSVERLTLRDGSRLVYKSQRLLPVEPAFYVDFASRTALLPGFRILTHDLESSTMLLEHLDQPISLDGRSVPEVVGAAHEVVGAIGSLPQGLPAYLDIGTTKNWQAEVDRTVSTFSTLIGDRRFVRCDADDVAFVADWSTAPDVLAAIEETSRLTNGDMKFDHVFCGESTFRLVDWSQATVGPAELDLVMLLEDQGIPPLLHVTASIVALRWFLHLRWAIEGKTRLLPAIPHMFDEWAAEAITRMRQAVSHQETVGRT